MIVKDCKRAFPINGPTEEDKERALLSVFTWIVAWRDYARQRDHVFCPIVEPEDCLPRDVLIATRPNEAPPQRAKTDDELDEMRVPLSIMPPVSWSYTPPHASGSSERDPIVAAAAAAVGGVAPLPPA